MSLNDDIVNFLKNRKIAAVYKVEDIDGNVVAFGKNEMYANQYDKNLFLVLSVTKQMTAYLILKAVEDGKLQLDNKIIDILDRSHYIWQNKIPEWANNVSIYELLSHSSGIQDYIYDAILKGVNLDDNQQAKIQSVNYSVNKPQKDKKFYYSNINYFILGLILESLYNDSLENIFQEKIFNPAGMTSTRFATAKDVLTPNDGSIVPIRKLIKGKGQNLNVNGQILLHSVNKISYDFNSDIFYASSLKILPFADGGVMSNVDDMISMMKFFYKTGLYNNNIGKQMFSKISKLQKRNSNSPIETYFGLGSHILDDRIYGHSGNAIGNRCEVFFINKHRKYFVVLFSDQQVLEDVFLSFSGDMNDLYDQYDVSTLLDYIVSELNLANF